MLLNRFSMFSIAATAMLSVAGLTVSQAIGQEAGATAEEAGKTIEVFDSATMETPAAWKTVQPKVSIIEHEFAATAGEDDGKARVTMMAASGSVDANVARWKGQFKLAENGVKQEKETVAGHTVHLIHLAGSYKETMGGGPFSGGRVVERDDYAMSGAIIVDPKGRQYFIKMIGPESVVKANREAFGEMVKGLEKK